MNIKYERNIAAFAAAVLLSLDCATATAGSSLMDVRAQATPPKANIFDPLPQRAPAMTPDERLKLQNDLTAARDRHTLMPKPDLPADRARPTCEAPNSVSPLVAGAPSSRPPLATAYLALRRVDPHAHGPRQNIKTALVEVQKSARRNDDNYNCHKPRHSYLIVEGTKPAAGTCLTGGPATVGPGNSGPANPAACRWGSVPESS